MVIQIQITAQMTQQDKKQKCVKSVHIVVVRENAYNMNT